MNDLLLDPSIVSIGRCVSASEATQFVERAIMWSRAEVRTGCRIVTSNRCLCGLYEENEYPSPHKIQELFRTIGIDQYDPHTVIRAIDGLLTISPKVEDVLGIDDVLVDSAETELSPTTLLKRLAPGVASSLVESFALCAVYSDISGAQYPMGIASTPCHFDRRDTLQCSLLVIEYVSSRLGGTSTPKSLTIACPILGSIEEVLEVLQFNDVCGNIERAIEWSWVHTLPPQERPSHPLRKFVIRREFQLRILELNLNRGLLEQLYRKVVHLLCRLDLPGLEIEPLRVDRGANSEQLVRGNDGAKAFRMQISQYGPGYHVHYWEVPGDSVELVWFGTHNDFYIPE